MSAAAAGTAAEAGEGALGGRSGRQLGRGEEPGRRAPFARLHPNDEIRGLDRPRLLGLELIIGEVDKLEALQQHGQDQRRLLQRELAADARALPGAEGLVGVGRNFRPVLGAEAVGVKRLGVVAPDFWIAVQHPGQHDDRAVRLHLILAAENGVLIRAAGEGGGGRPEPQRFLEDLRDKGQLVDLGVGRQPAHIRSQHPVHLLVGPLEDLRVLDELIEREGEKPACRLVTGDKEGDALRDDVGLVELFARLAVDAGQHPVEEVVDLAQCARLAPLFNDVAHGLDHELLVGPRLLRPPGFELGLDGQFTRDRLRRLKRVQHGEDERVRSVAIEGVEPVVEAAERDRVQGQPRHIGWDVHRVVCVQPLPFQHQLRR